MLWNIIPSHRETSVGITYKIVKQSLDRPLGFQEVEAPRFLDNRHMKMVTLSDIRTGRLYPPGNIPGTHFCWKLSRPQVHSAAERIMSMKNPNDIIRNRTRDLPTCAVPQPTVPQRVSYILNGNLLKKWGNKFRNLHWSHIIIWIIKSRRRGEWGKHWPFLLEYLYIWLQSDRKFLLSSPPEERKENQFRNVLVSRGL
jgi:hypothetical protein